MKVAYVAIRELPHYRREAFCEGLRECGYEINFGYPGPINAETVYVSWNRYREWHDTATRIEKAGGRVVVAENGFVGNDENGRHLFALARGGHNGSGWTPTGGPGRWDALGIDLKPWRTSGGHILVAPNRSFGRPDMIMPPDWASDVRCRMAAVTKREIRVRPHPGNSSPTKPLAEDLAGAHCVVIWSSSVGVHALVAGIPVICESPFWICKAATELGGIGGVERAEGNEIMRRSALECMAWAQFSISEIASGEPFNLLLQKENGNAMAI